MEVKKKLIRITTVAVSLDKLLGNQLCFMKQFYEVIAISAGRDDLTRVGLKEGVATYNVELTREITPIKDLLALWKLFLFFKKERPFIVHSHTPKAGTIGLIAARLAGVPHRLHTIAGLPLLEATGLKRILLNFVEKVTYACATKIYPNSAALKTIIIEQGFCKAEKLLVLGNGSSNGIDINYFNAEQFTKEANQNLRNTLGIASNDFIFIFIGRLVVDKGVNELINAFKTIQLACVNAKLLIVGASEANLNPLSDDILQQIAKNDRIVSVGYQNDVRPYLAISNVLVLPSYREGFPNVVMQAGAMHLPCIVTDINGCNEIILEEKNGLIVPAKDFLKLSLAMRRIYDDRRLWQKLTDKARYLIVSRYQQNEFWNSILSEYKKLEPGLPKVIRTATVSMSLDILLKGQLAYLNEKFEVIAVSGEDFHLKNVLKREKVKTINLKMSRSISPFKDFITLIKLYLLFKHEKPVIVHSITPKAGLLSMIAAYFARVPVRIHTFTGLIFPYKAGIFQWLLILTDKVLCRCATVIIPEGEGVKVDLLKYNITIKPMQVLSNGNVNGIDTGYFSPEQVTADEQYTLRKDLQLDATDFVFIFIGRIVADKGANELVSAFSQLKTPNAKLILVGSFEDKINGLDSFTLSQIQKNQHIITVGFQSDVRPYLAVSHCLILPSYREGFPNVVMQAGAMGLPCIVTDINGSNEIILDHENGIVIAKKDIEALVNAMVKIQEDENLLVKCQSNARIMITKRYEQKLVWAAILNKYKSLLKNVQNIY